MVNKLLTVKQAGELIGLGKRRTLHYIHTGDLRAAKHGRDWLITLSDAFRFRGTPRTPPGRPRSS